LSDEFKVASSHLLKDPYNHDLYLKVLNYFGTHYFSDITLGAKYSMQSKFSLINYESLNDEKFNFDIAAKASFWFISGSAEYLSEDEKIAGKKYNAQRLSYEESTIGSHPSTDGKWETWAQSSAETPVPIQYTVTPLSELFIEDYFPEANITVLYKIKHTFEDLILNYCQVMGVSCTFSRPDLGSINYHINSVAENSLDPKYWVGCPDNMALIGVGIQNGYIMPDCGQALSLEFTSYNGNLGVLKPYCDVASIGNAYCLGKTLSNGMKLVDFIYKDSMGDYDNLRRNFSSCPTGYVVIGCYYHLEANSASAFGPVHSWITSTMCVCQKSDDNPNVKCYAADKIFQTLKV